MTEEAKPYVTAGIVKLFSREMRDEDQKVRVFSKEVHDQSRVEPLSAALDRPRWSSRNRF
jgi:hypothetical protein